MIDAFSPFVALRYLVTRRINLLGVGGVMVAVWAILLVDSVFTGFVGQIRDDVRASAAQLMVTTLPHDTGYETLRAAIEADPAVAHTAPRLRHHGLVQPFRARRNAFATSSSQVDFNHTESGFALLVGIAPDREAATTGFRDWLRRGPEALENAARHAITVPPSPVLDEPEATRRAELGMPAAAEWQARRRAGLPHEREVTRQRASWPGVLLGWQRIRSGGTWYEPSERFDIVCASFLAGESTATLHTHALPFGFAGCFATGHRALDEAMAIVPIATLRTMLGQHELDPGYIDLVTDVAVRLRDGLSNGAIDAAKARLQQRVQAVLPAGAPACECLDWEEQNQVFLSAVAHEQGMMQFVLFVVMLVAAFVIYATLHMMVVQKVKDIGILASLGGSPRSIGAVFLLCGLVVALLGTALGLGAGLLSATYLNAANDWLHAQTGLELFPRRLFDLREVPCRIEPTWVATVAIGAIVLALLVALVPSRNAARWNPVQALAHE